MDLTQIREVAALLKELGALGVLAWLIWLHRPAPGERSSRRSQRLNGRDADS